MLYFLCTLFVGGLMFLWSFVGLFERKRKRDPTVSCFFFKRDRAHRTLEIPQWAGFFWKTSWSQESWDPSVSRVLLKRSCTRNFEILRWAGFVKEIVHTEILRSLSELGFVKDIVGTELLASTWRELDLMCLRDTWQQQVLHHYFR